MAANRIAEKICDGNGAQKSCINTDQQKTDNIKISSNITDI